MRNSEFSRDIKFELIATFPNGERYSSGVFTVDGEMDAAQALPKDREIFWPSALRASQIEAARVCLASWIFQKLAVAFAPYVQKALASRDPVNGYSPEEWAKITEPIERTK